MKAMYQIIILLIIILLFNDCALYSCLKVLNNLSVK